MATKCWLNHLIKLSTLIFLLCTASKAFSCDDESCEHEALFYRGDINALEAIWGTKEQPITPSPYIYENYVRAVVSSGNMELMKYMASRGWLTCTKDEVTGNDCDILRYAVRNGSVEMLKFLMSHGYSVTLASLRESGKWGNLQALKLFCSIGANFEQKFEYHVYGGTNPGKHIGTMLDELKNQPSTWFDRYPLAYARVIANRIKAVEYLESGQCKEAENKPLQPDTYIMEVDALRSGNMNAAKTLLEQRNTSNDNLQVQVYELYEATASGNLELLQYLRGLGWLERCRKESSCLPQHVAAKEAANVKILDFLISEGFKVDAYDQGDRGMTPLMYATLSGQLDKVKLLCRHGADYRKYSFYHYQLHSTPESLLAVLREPYNYAWCALNQRVLKVSASTESADKNGEVDVAWNICREDAGDPRELRCAPGETCAGIVFPPKGPENDVKHIVALSEVFQYLRSGQCRSTHPEVCFARPAKSGTVIADNMQVRAEPNIQSRIIATISYGTPVNVTDHSRNCETVEGRIGRWIKIAVSNFYNQRQLEIKEGWVFDTYIDYLPDEH